MNQDLGALCEGDARVDGRDMVGIRPWWERVRVKTTVAGRDHSLDARTITRWSARVRLRDVELHERMVMGRHFRGKLFAGRHNSETMSCQ